MNKDYINQIEHLMELKTQSPIDAGNLIAMMQVYATLHLAQIIERTIEQNDEPICKNLNGLGCPINCWCKPLDGEQ